MAKTAILVTDLDNTLYDFAEYFSPCFRAMVHALARELHIDEKSLTADFRAIYERHNTIEYTFAVQELPFVAEQSQQEIERLVHIANVAFGRTRRRRLRLYPQVLEVLTWITNSGGKISAVTNAPTYQAYKRLHDLGILRFFSTISTREGIHIPETQADYAEKFERAMLQIQGRLATYSSNDLKPQIDMFQATRMFWTERLGANATFYSMGDSLQSDLYPSSRAGMTTIWAKYGTRIDPKNLDTMLSLTPAFTKRHFESEIGDFSPDYIAEEFSDLFSIIPLPYQQKLF